MEKRKIKGYLCAILVAAPLIIWIATKEEKKELPQQETETIIKEIIKGEYSYYVGKFGVSPVTDSAIIAKGYLTKDEYYDLPIEISSSGLWRDSDTLQISSDKDLLEAAIILVGKVKQDTLNFRIHYDTFADYIACVSEHNMVYEDLEKVIFVYCEEGGNRQEFTLSMQEFSKHFEGATKALKLRKLTKSENRIIKVK